jgi:hypothetical protein
MIIISAQPNWHFFKVGLKKEKKNKIQKKNELFSFNRINDKQLIVFHLMMMIRLLQIYMQYIKVTHPYLLIQLSKQKKINLKKKD